MTDLSLGGGLTLQVVHDGGGFPTIRLFDAQRPVDSPDRIIADRVVDSVSYGARVVGNGVSDLLIDGLTVTNSKNGIALLNTGATSIVDMTFENMVPDGSLFGSVIRIGSKAAEHTTKGVTFIQDVEADGNMSPLGRYGNTPNTDFLVVEAGSAPVMLRDVTASGFSDSIIDCKSTVYIMNATLEGAHRVLRAHEGATIVIVNSVLEGGPNSQALAWLEDSTSRIYYYNTTWNGKGAPGIEDVRGEGGMTPAQALKNVVQLRENPLPALSPFFASDFDRVSIEIQNAKGQWVDTGLGGRPGDLRFDFGEFGLRDGQVRVSIFLGDKPVGARHVVDLATGAVVEAPWPAAGFRSAAVDASALQVDGPALAEASANGDGKDDHPREVKGGDGDDSLQGSDRADHIFGGDGSDLIHGRNGDDRIEGGAGDDRLHAAAGNDTVYAGAGDDLVRVGLGDDVAHGGDGADTLVGDGGDDVLWGDAGTDDISGDAGADSLHGGGGDDVIKGGLGADRIQGDAGDDVLRGGEDDDLLFGGTGDDDLFGEEGNDTLDGGEGSDSLAGGDGDDLFVFQLGASAPARDVVSGGRGFDTVAIWLHMGTGQALDTVLDQVSASARAALAGSAAGETPRMTFGLEQIALRGVEAVAFHNLDEPGTAYSYSVDDFLI